MPIFVRDKNKQLQQLTIVGKQGPQGPKGDTGERGPQGLQGTAGAKGATGATGPKGDKGDTGATWRPSVDTSGNLSWTQNSSTNSPTTVNIKGPKGDKGDQGIQGPQGVKGAIGATGPKGDKGDTGPQGPQGTVGAKGATGVSMRLLGAWSSSTAYVNNSAYIDLVTYSGNTYACKTSNTGQTPTNTTYWTLVAQKGATGSQGPKGDKGDQGIQGPQGVSWRPAVDTSGNLSWTQNASTTTPTTVNIKGPKGDTGAKGATGSQGPKGDTGATGPNTVTTSTTTSGFTNGHYLYNNNGKVGAKAITPATIGALPLTGGTVTGSTIFNKGIQLSGVPTNDIPSLLPPTTYPGYSRVFYDPVAKEFVMTGVDNIRLASKGATVYTTANKPAPVEIGALSINGGTISNTVLPQLAIRDPSGKAAELLFDRNTNANWKMTTTGGNFRLQCDYTSGKVPLYDVMNFSYNSGHLTLKGDIYQNGTVHALGKQGTHSFIEWYRGSQLSTRLGWIGSGSSGLDDLTFRSERGKATIISQKSMTVASEEREINMGGSVVPIDSECYLGLPEKESRWKQVVTTAGVLSASDIKEKENIVRVNGNQVSYNEKENKIVELDSKSSKKSRAISTDYYDFIKDRFNPTYYNYKATEFTKNIDTTSYNTEGSNIISDETLEHLSIENEERLLNNVGFIAQDYDLETDKVAKEFIFKDNDGNLMYNHMSYVTVGLVALQEAIKEIEKLKEEIEILKNK